MKHILAAIPLFMVAACGGGAEEKEKAAVAATSLAQGQYEVTREVTAFRSTDNATPLINTPVGTRTTDSICVGAGDRPPAELFVGAGGTCNYGNYYMRNGRINSSIVCRREGLPGEVRMVAYGTFTADNFESTVDTTTFFPGEGDAVITTRTNGRRTGDCQAGTPAAAGNSSGAAKQ